MPGENTLLYAPYHGRRKDFLQEVQERIFPGGGQ